MGSSVYIAVPPAVIGAGGPRYEPKPSERQCHDATQAGVSGRRLPRPPTAADACCRAGHLQKIIFRRHSAATRWARAWAMRASSSTGTIGVKSRCAIHSARVNLVMWLETAQSVRYTILRG